MDAKELGAQPAAEMTKRDAFAIAAMQGLLSNPELEPINGLSFADAAASSAVMLADALLAELAKE